jgi:hypothetical protein
MTEERSIPKKEALWCLLHLAPRTMGPLFPSAAPPWWRLSLIDSTYSDGTHEEPHGKFTWAICQEQPSMTLGLLTIEWTSWSHHHNSSVPHTSTRQEDSRAGGRPKGMSYNTSRAPSCLCLVSSALIHISAPQGGLLRDWLTAVTSCGEGCLLFLPPSLPSPARTGAPMW